jgi:hypothetical protein
MVPMMDPITLWKWGGLPDDGGPVVDPPSWSPIVIRPLTSWSVIPFAVGLCVTAIADRLEPIERVVLVAALFLLLLGSIRRTRRLERSRQFLMGISMTLGVGVGTNLFEELRSWRYQAPLLALVIALPFLIRHWEGRAGHCGSDGGA